MSAVDDAEAAEAFLLGARGFIVDGEMHHHALVFIIRLLGTVGCAAVTGQAVAVCLAVRPVHHHAFAMRQATRTRQRLAQKTKMRGLVTCRLILVV